MQEVDALYDEIGLACIKLFRELYMARYTELWKWLKGRNPKEDEIDELFEMYLAKLLNEPNDVTHYAFQTELIRKRDRAKEAILSVPTRTQKQLELEKAIRHLTQQVGFYVDITEDEASLQALKDAGIKKVRWNIYGDDRVCSVCEDLDGEIFPIDEVPIKPHPRCRCYLTPA